jgi:hypothetical protein
VLVDRGAERSKACSTPVWPVNAVRSGRIWIEPTASAARALLARAAEDGERPLAVHVEVVADAVHVPDLLAGGARADLGELQALRAEEPLHVRGGRAQAERVDHALAHRAQLA